MTTFAKSVIAAAAGIISSLLGGYFIWLGLVVNSIGKDVARMNAHIEQLLSERRERQ